MDTFLSLFRRLHKKEVTYIACEEEVQVSRPSFRPPAKVKRDEDLSALADWSTARLNSPSGTRTLEPKVLKREEVEG